MTYLDPSDEFWPSPVDDYYLKRELEEPGKFDEPLKTGRNVIVKPEPKQHTCEECGTEIPEHRSWCNPCFDKQTCPDCHKLAPKCVCWLNL